MKSIRIKKLIKLSVMTLFLGIIYAYISGLGYGFKCYFYEITNLKCPSCGITRMFLSLMQFDIKSAFECNFAIMTLSPIFIYLLISSATKYIKTGAISFNKLDNSLIFICCLVLLLYSIFRNTIFI